MGSHRMRSMAHSWTYEERNGQVFTWGYNDYGQLGHGDREERSVPTKVLGLDGLVITKISCGSYFTAARTVNGEIFTWYVRS